VVGEGQPTDAASRPALRTLASSIRSVRTRLLGGVPWGTLTLCVLLVVVYLVVQRGVGGRPLTIPFTSWSYSQPLGVLLSPVAHLGPDHLIDNLVGVLVFGSMAEYVVGHVPRDGTGRDRPWNHAGARAFVLFPGAALLAGIVASAFSWGPTLGFSNVVFGFAGLALVRYPLGTVVALSARDALAVVVRAAEQPIFVAGRTSAADPWFVDTAVQSHAFGLLLGVAVGMGLLVARDADPPSPFRLWTGVALFALVQSLWAIWWPQGTTYVLARGPGVALVACLATLVTVGAALATSGVGPLGDERTRQIGFAALVVPLAVTAGIAVPINATADVTAPPGAETVDVGGYAVTYAEGVQNQRLAPFAAVTGEPAQASGVLVVHPERGVWTRAVSAQALASDGTAAVRLGGLGWDRTVFAVRRAWETADGDAASQVWLNPKDGGFHRVYASPPARAAPVVEGYNVTVVPRGVRFRLRVSRDNETVGTIPVPDRGKNVTVGTLEIRREGEQLVAVANRTRVVVARRK
jgi:membrane associated rhomboid family serine protease